MFVDAVGIVDEDTTLLDTRRKLVETLLVESNHNIVSIEYRT